MDETKKYIIGMGYRGINTITEQSISAAVRTNG